jgi:phage-related baseplate assembly protein
LTQKDVIVYAVPENYGTAANTIAINTIDDWGTDSTGRVYSLSFVYSFTNSAVPINGAAAETDDNYRRRLKIANAQYQEQGNEDRYAYDLMAAFPDIIDVSITSVPGEVSITILPKNFLDWTVPELAALKTRVETLVDTDEYSFICFTASVSYPTQVSQAIAVSIVPYEGINTTDLNGKITDVLNEYKDYIESRMGLDIVPSQIVKRIMQIDGIYDISLTTPASKITIAKNQIAYISSITITISAPVAE